MDQPVSGAATSVAGEGAQIALRHMAQAMAFWFRTAIAARPISGTSAKAIKDGKELGLMIDSGGKVKERA